MQTNNNRRNLLIVIVVVIIIAVPLVLYINNTTVKTLNTGAIAAVFGNPGSNPGGAGTTPCAGTGICEATSATGTNKTQNGNVSIPVNITLEQTGSVYVLLMTFAYKDLSTLQPDKVQTFINGSTYILNGATLSQLSGLMNWNLTQNYTLSITGKVAISPMPADNTSIVSVAFPVSTQ